NPTKIGNSTAVVTVEAATCTVANSTCDAKLAFAAEIASGVATAFPAVDPSEAPTIGFHLKSLKTKYPNVPVTNTVNKPNTTPPSPPSTILPKSIPIPNEKAKAGINIELPLFKNALISSSKLPRTIHTIIGNRTDTKETNENIPSTNPIAPKIAKATRVKNGSSFNARSEYAALSVLSPYWPADATY